MVFFLWHRFVRSVGIVDNVPSRKFLEAALSTNDNMIFYTVFKFFEQRNQRLWSNPRFQQGNPFATILSLNFDQLYSKICNIHGCTIANGNPMIRTVIVCDMLFFHN